MRKKISVLMLAAVLLVAGMADVRTLADGDGITDAVSKTITKAEVKKVVLKHARLTEAQVTFTKVKLDTEDSEYDVEFYYGNTEYDYEVDALTGDILEFDSDIEDFVIPEKVISLKKAKKIACKEIGVKYNAVSYIDAKLEKDDGVSIYEIEFIYDGKEYDFEINAVNGKILSYDYDIEDYDIPVAKEAKISRNKAKRIALKHAGLKAADVTFTKAKLDRDDGVQKYEIEFRQGRIEYEYEIDAETGDILEYDSDIDD